MVRGDARCPGGRARVTAAALDDAYFEHGADIGVRGCGATIEQAFVRAAEATFAIMTDGAVVRPDLVVDVTFDESDPELALVRWLNALLAEARVRGLLLGRFTLRCDGDRWIGQGWGEGWSPALARGVEVKGATLTMLAVEDHGGEWEARCVVDV